MTRLGTMVVTSNHNILVEDVSTSQPTFVEASILKQWEADPMGNGPRNRQTGTAPRVYDGAHFQAVAARYYKMGADGGSPELAAACNNVLTRLNSVSAVLLRQGL